MSEDKIRVIASFAVTVGVLSLLPGFGLVAGPVGIMLALVALIAGDGARKRAAAGLALSVLGYGLSVGLGLALLAPPAGSGDGRAPAQAETAMPTPDESETDSESTPAETCTPSAAAATAAEGTPAATPTVQPDAAAPTPGEQATPEGHIPPLDAPNLVLRDLNNQAHALRCYRGKIVLLIMWASWCPWSKRQLEELQALAERQRDVVLLGVSTEPPETQRRFASATPAVRFPLLQPGGHPLPPLLAQVQAVPTVFVIDSEGKVRYRLVGRQPPHVWETIVDDLR